MTLDSDRGRIQPPDLDDRRWQDLVEEMRALVPHYAPAWTDHNPSDIGMTLIELFAWLAESVIYRLNRVPEKNYLAFVNLLGITRTPASPAHTHLTFTAGTSQPVVVPAGTQAQTVPREGETPVVFETDESVRVLPVALATAAVVHPGEGGGPRYDDVSVPVVGPPAGTYRLEVPAGGTVQLCLGFDAATSEELALGLRLYRPLPDVDALVVDWTYSRGDASPTAWPEVPDEDRVDGTGRLRHDGTVRLRVPRDWAAQQPSAVPDAPPPGAEDPPTWSGVLPAVPGGALTTPRFWIGLRVANPTGDRHELGVDRVLFNAAIAHTALTLRADEVLGTSDGRPHQMFALAHRPLYRRPQAVEPYADLVVEVGTGTPPVWQAWTAVEHLPAGAEPVYRVDPVTGEIRFGDHDADHPAGNGSIPPPGATVRARYRHVVAGAVGNVAAGQVTHLATTLTGELPHAVAGVTNLGRAVDGADEEPVEETLRRAPEQLKIRDRAVTADDYEFLAREASGEVALCRCLPPRLRRAPSSGVAEPPWAFGRINRSPGVVNVIIVPDQGADVARPEPTPDLLREVKAHLDRRRDLAAQLEVLGPRYLPVVVVAEIVVWNSATSAGLSEDVVRDQTEERIAAFLHPTRGGPDRTGWQVGQPVFSSDVFRAIMPPADVGYIAALQLVADAPLYPPPRPSLGATTPGASVRLADYELVCAAGVHRVTVVQSPD